MRLVSRGYSFLCLALLPLCGFLAFPRYYHGCYHGCQVLALISRYPVLYIGSGITRAFHMTDADHVPSTLVAYLDEWYGPSRLV